LRKNNKKIGSGVLTIIKNARDDQFMETAQILKNAQNAQKLAFRLFPNEQWIGIDQHIFMAASRAPRSGR
jgi:hypothetical protein